MSLLAYNDVREGKVIIYDEEPWVVVSSHVFRKQQRKPVNATKLKNLFTGRVAEISFAVSDKVEEADISEREVKYLYMNKGEYWFCETNDPSKRFTLSEDVVGNPGKFLKSNTEAKLRIFTNDADEEQIIGVKVPVKMDLKVKEAPPSIKGASAQNSNKVVTLETGAQVNVPLFINEGDIVRINTETGEYVERAS